MKKIISIFLSIIFTVMLGLTTCCSARDVSVVFNGSPLDLEQPPIIQDGRTLVPFRGIFEAFGAEVSWDGTTKTVTGALNGKEVVLVIGETDAYVNGEKKVLDVAPQIKNDFTMVPLRFISESLGAEVEWDAVTRTVKIVLKNGLTVVFVDVGQGDCQLIMCDGKVMLIDGGTADMSSRVVAILKKYNISYIDYVVCTHAHADHCGGLAGAVRTCKVGKVIMPKSETDSKVFTDFKSGVLNQDSEIINPTPGYCFSLGAGNVVVLGPVNENTSDLNNTSIVLKLTYGSKSILFTGDCESVEEHDILDTGADLSADVLKVGHHGSENSTTYTFLREIMPEYAVISAGKDNSYGHPTEEALSRLRDAGVKVFRTDLQGDIIITTDGNELNFATSKNHEIQTNPTEKPEQNEMVYIGNKKSKKLHKPTCNGLPDEGNRIYFSARAEAIDLGYEPCKRCNP